jgi:mRNA-degrading endonuclease RelE of RelBE toxin-antitoxin system
MVEPPATPPARTLVQAPRFGREKKRLPAAAQLAVDKAVQAILADPLSGEPKVGALRGVRIVKFKVLDSQVLLAYQFQEKANRVELLDVGPHENFYRDLQRYLDAR